MVKPSPVEANPLDGALLVEIRTTRKVDIALERFEFRPITWTDSAGNQSTGFEVAAGGQRLGELLFCPKVGQWFHESPLTPDRQGESEDFATALLKLIRAVWPDAFRRLMPVSRSGCQNQQPEQGRPAATILLKEVQ